MSRKSTLTALGFAAFALVSCSKDETAPPPAPKPAAASTEKPAEKPVVKPADKPVDKPAEKPAAKPADKPADTAKPADASKPAKPAEAKFPGDAPTGEWVTTASGLKYADIKVGTGAKPAGSSTTVKVHYTLWLPDGTKIESSVGGSPAQFALNHVIKGWTEGVGSMSVGGKRKLICPPDLAYGNAPPTPKIPPGSTLVFDVELIGIVQ
jgi:FKBP-type peptidyl-prolyl cis-trans isomerase